MGMGQINDVRGAAEDKLTFDPDVDASISLANTDGTPSGSSTGVISRE